MNISNCIKKNLRSKFLCGFLTLGSIFSMNAQEVGAQENQIQELGITEQDLQKYVAQAFDTLVTTILKQTDKLDGILEDLCQATANNNALKLKNPDQIIEQIKNIRMVIAQVKNKKIAQVDAGALQHLMAFNRVLMEHFSEALAGGLKEIPALEPKLIVLHKKAATISLENIEEELLASEKQLFALEKQSANFGLSWFNKGYRWLTNSLALAHKRKWDRNLAIGGLVGGIGTDMVFNSKYGWKDSERYRAEEIITWADSEDAGGKYVEENVLPRIKNLRKQEFIAKCAENKEALRVFISQPNEPSAQETAKFLGVDWAEKIDSEDGFTSKQIENFIELGLHTDASLSWWNQPGVWFRNIFGYPILQTTDGKKDIVSGHKAMDWNSSKVNLFGKAVPLFRMAASKLFKYGTVIAFFHTIYGGKYKWWGDDLKEWGGNKLAVIHARAIGGIAGKQAEQAAQKDAMESWEPQYTFDDVVGFDHIKEVLNRILEYMKDPERFDRANIPPEKGYLFTGLPGTGKSFVAEAFGGEIRRAFKEIGRKEDELGFYNIPAVLILEKGVEWLVDTAKRESPCVIFIDEIDLLRLQRGGKGNDTLLSDCLNAMSGVMSKEDGKQVILIAATNKPEHLDRALRRRGRFGKIINFELPTLAERKTFFVNKLEPLLPSLEIVDIDSLAQETEGCTYEELTAMMNTAFQKSKLSGAPICQENLEDALNEEIRNVINKDMYVSEPEQELMATHQAGHALALELLETRQELAAVTIKPITAKLEDEALKHFKERKQKDVEYGKVFTRCSFDHLGVLTHDEIIKECKILLSGMAAERILLGSCGHSYHAEDKQEALDLVKSIVFQGLNMKKMPVDLQTKYFEKALDLLEQYEQEAEALLREHKDVLRQIAQELQKQKTLSARRVKEIMNGNESGAPVEGSATATPCAA